MQDASESPTAQTPGRTVLIVLRTAAVAELLASQFRSEGVAPLIANCATSGIQLAGVIQPDAIVLDLDDEDWERTWNDIACREQVEDFLAVALTMSLDCAAAFRVRQMPFVLCRQKPFVPRHLVAEIAGRMRSDAAAHRTRLIYRLLDSRGVRVNTNRQVISRGTEPVDTESSRPIGEPLGLATVELRLLKLLADHAGKPMTRKAIARGLWGSDAPRDPRTVDQNVRRLRQRLAEAGFVDLVRTIPGVGYRLSVPAGEKPSAKEPGDDVTRLSRARGSVSPAQEFIPIQENRQ